jgi:hypothetical protein
MVVDAADAPEKRKALTWLEPRVAGDLQYNELMRGRLRAPVLGEVLAAAP